MALHATIFTLLFFSLEKLQKRCEMSSEKRSNIYLNHKLHLFTSRLGNAPSALHSLIILSKSKTKTEVRTEVTQADPERLPADWIIWVKYEYHKEQVRNNTRNHLRDQQELPETVWQTGHLKKHCGQGDRVINHQKLFHCSKAYHLPF